MGIARRSVVKLAATAVGAAGVTACAGPPSPSRPGAAPPGSPAARAADVGRQDGVDGPVPRQRFVEVAVWDVVGPAGPRGVLAAVGDAVQDLLGRAAPAAALTITVGVAPALVRAAGRTGAGSVDLPAFARERIEPGDRGGDVMVQVCADDRPTVTETVTALGDAVRGWRPRWSVAGFRGDVVAPFSDVGRNLLGFHDGTANPRSSERLDTDVWTTDSDEVPGATVCVVRRMPVDVEGFTALPTRRQEEVIGRRKGSGRPLSGGRPQDDVDLQAKSDAGVYDIAPDAHVRRAHPFVSGAGILMLRRSYGFDDGEGGRGQLFICFQRDVEVFTATQRSLDEGDALMAFATTTASGTWLVLPWPAGTRLGDALWA